MSPDFGRIVGTPELWRAQLRLTYWPSHPRLALLVTVDSIQHRIGLMLADVSSDFSKRVVGFPNHDLGYDQIVTADG